MIDILEAIYTNKISEEDAYKKCRDIISLYPSDFDWIQLELCLSDREWNAFRWGATFLDMANWRYKGWPQECFSCHYPLRYEDEEWICDEGIPRHSSCSAESKKRALKGGAVEDK